MAEELTDRLCKLGLTSKQARVYLSIAQNKEMRIPEIANSTKIHEQDISKILPKLEQIGLITKTTTKPIVVEALPVRIALNELIKKQQENLNEQRRNANEIIKAIETKKAFKQKKYEAKVLILNTKSPNYTNNLVKAFLEARKSWDLLGTRETTNEFLKIFLPYFREYERQTFKKYQIKIRIVSQPKIMQKDDFSDIDFKKYSSMDMSIKRISPKMSASLPFLIYAIIDGNELRAGVTGDPNYEDKIVVTNCKTIVKIAQENFERAWNDSSSELIFTTRQTNNLPTRVPTYPN